MWGGDGNVELQRCRHDRILILPTDPVIVNKSRDSDSCMRKVPTPTKMGNRDHTVSLGHLSAR